MNSLSILGLDDDHVEYADEEPEPEEPHSRRNLVLAVAAVIGDSARLAVVLDSRLRCGFRTEWFGLPAEWMDFHRNLGTEWLDFHTDTCTEWLDSCKERVR